MYSIWYSCPDYTPFLTTWQDTSRPRLKRLSYFCTPPLTCQSICKKIWKTQKHWSLPAHQEMSCMPVRLPIIACIQVQMCDQTHDRNREIKNIFKYPWRDCLYFSGLESLPLGGNVKGAGMRSIKNGEQQSLSRVAMATLFSSRSRWSTESTPMKACGGKKTKCAPMTWNIHAQTYLLVYNNLTRLVEP